MGIAYKMGRWAGRHKILSVMLAIVLIRAVMLLNVYASEPLTTPSTLSEAKMTAPLSKAETDAADAKKITVAAAEAKAEKARRKKEGVRIGMSKQEALDSLWGKPQKINRTINARGVREQWVYGNSYLYFDEDTLTTIQN